MKTMTEREAIDFAQKSLGDLKSALNRIQVINNEAGRLEAANAAMGLRGEVMTLHAKATEALYRFKPDEAGGIVAQGGGDR